MYDDKKLDVVTDTILFDPDTETETTESDSKILSLQLQPQHLSSLQWNHICQLSQRPQLCVDN